MRIEVCQVWLFAILQMYEFSSKSQPRPKHLSYMFRCLRYCKCTSFQANHNYMPLHFLCGLAVCDTANVRVFKQITTTPWYVYVEVALFAILQMYEFSSKSQPSSHPAAALMAVCDTANVRVFKQITTIYGCGSSTTLLFAILQMYEFSSKSQQQWSNDVRTVGCL